MPADSLYTQLCRSIPNVDLSTGTHVVLFHTTWSAPARMAQRIWDELAGEFEGNDLTCHFINVDEMPNSMDCPIEDIPSVFFVEDAAVTQQFIGALPKPQMRQQLDKLVGDAR